MTHLFRKNTLALTCIAVCATYRCRMIYISNRRSISLPHTTTHLHSEGVLHLVATAAEALWRCSSVSVSRAAPVYTCTRCTRACTQSISVDDLIYLLNYVAYYLSLIDLHANARLSYSYVRFARCFSCIRVSGMAYTNCTCTRTDHTWNLCVPCV